MDECIFCKIAKGEIPCYKVYEDNEFLVFLDVNPIVEGHSLIISKEHFENIFKIPEDVLGRMNILSKKIADMLKEKLGINAVNILNASGKEAQQSVFHIHYHIIPRKKEDGLDLWFHGGSEGEKNLDETLKKLKE